MGDKVLFNNEYEANEVIPYLFMGGAPPASAGLSEFFDVIVLCSSEYQPSDTCYPHSLVIHCPFEDNIEPIPQYLRKEMVSVSDFITSQVKSKKRVLVTCFAGLNRSGLITALTLTRGFNKSGPECVSLIRSARGNKALSNPMFLKYILG